MKLRRLVVLATILSFISAGTAPAVYNVPAKAKKIKDDMVVAYNICVAPNATQFFAGTGIIGACTPPTPTTNTNATNVTTFGIKGAANVQAGVITGDIKIGIKALDILNNGVPANSINLGTSTSRVVATSGNCAPGAPPQPAPVPGTECTSTDLSSLFGAIFSVPCTAGKCQLKTTVNTIIPGAITAGGKINIELAGVSLNDPDGDRAFTVGLFLP
jgi:hypothetical protein